jgi:hypothetical protein
MKEISRKKFDKFLKLYENPVHIYATEGMILYHDFDIGTIAKVDKREKKYYVHEKVDIK